MSIKTQIDAKAGSNNSSRIVPQSKPNTENKFVNLTQSELNSVVIYNQQVASQLYGVSARDLSVQVQKNLGVKLNQERIHQFTESNLPDKNVGQHYYVAALPVNPNIAPTSRSFMQNSNYTPLDAYSFLQEKGLEFNTAVVSAMLDTYRSKVIDIDINHIFEQFKAKENWVLDENQEEVKHFLAEISKIFNFFSKNEAPIRSFVNINDNTIYLIILFDMLNIEYFTLLYNWIVAQDVQAMNDLLHNANRTFERIYQDKQTPNYTQNFTQGQIYMHDMYMKSILSLYERIRYFKKWNVANSVFGEKNQSMIQSFLNKRSNIH